MKKKTKKIIETSFPESDNIKTEILNARTGQNVQKIIELVKKDINIKYKTIGIWCMICGVPNVGKSTLINTFKGLNREITEVTKKSAKTAPLPTTTRHIDYFRVSVDPTIFLIDSPGVMPPKITNNDSGLKLSICGSIKEKIVGKDIICDYLLHLLNKNQNFTYVKALKLKDSSDNLHEVLNKLCETYKIQNFNNSYDFFIKSFRDGKFGKLTLDDDIGKSVISVNYKD